MKPSSTPPASPSAGGGGVDRVGRDHGGEAHDEARCDRSMPPEMMTKVWPVASRSGATAKIAIDWRLKGLRMKVPPKPVRAQASNTTISAARNSQARRSAMRWTSVLASSAWSACGLAWASSVAA